jgi:hypothetical protein
MNAPTSPENVPKPPKTVPARPPRVGWREVPEDQFNVPTLLRVLFAPDPPDRDQEGGEDAA